MGGRPWSPAPTPGGAAGSLWAPMGGPRAPGKGTGALWRRGLGCGGRQRLAQRSPRWAGGAGPLGCEDGLRAPRVSDSRRCPGSAGGRSLPDSTGKELSEKAALGVLAPRLPGLEPVSARPWKALRSGAGAAQLSRLPFFLCSRRNRLTSPRWKAASNAMSLQWTAVATFLYAEVFAVLLLCIPFISPKRYGPWSAQASQGELLRSLSLQSWWALELRPDGSR